MRVKILSRGWSARFLWAVVLLVPSFGALCSVGQENEPEIALLIKKLSNDNPQLREEAARLLTSREDAVPALRLALKSNDPEVARLAEIILADAAEARRKKWERRLLAFGKSKQVDLLAESLVAWPEETLADAWWQASVDAAWDLIALEQANFNRTQLKTKTENHRGVDWRDFARFASQPGCKIFPPGRPTLEIPKRKTRTESCRSVCRAEKLNDMNQERHNGHWQGVAAVSSEARLISPSISFLNCGGDVFISDTCGSSIIICGGNCVIDDGIGSSILIARGNVRVAAGIINSVVLAGGDVDTGDGFVNNSTIRAVGKVKLVPGRPPIKASEVVANDPKALDSVRFFEFADLGLSAALAEKRLRVERLVAESPLARAGLCVGDVLVVVGVQTPADVETLRRALRRAMVEGKTTLKVEREGQVREIPVRFME